MNLVAIYHNINIRLHATETIDNQHKNNKKNSNVLFQNKRFLF